MLPLTKLERIETIIIKIYKKRIQERTLLEKRRMRILNNLNKINEEKSENEINYF